MSLLIQTLCTALFFSLSSSAMAMGGPMAMMKMMKKPMEFYRASGPDDNCGTVPADVKIGNVKAMACEGSSVQDELCVCIKPKMTPEAMSAMAKMMPEMSQSVNPDTGFALKCGHCRDPCGLMFVPAKDGPMGGHNQEDMQMEMMAKVPKMLQKFATLMDEGKLQEVNPFKMVLEAMEMKMDE